MPHHFTLSGGACDPGGSLRHFLHLGSSHCTHTSSTTAAAILAGQGPPTPSYSSCYCDGGVVCITGDSCGPTHSPGVCSNVTAAHGDGDQLGSNTTTAQDTSAAVDEGYAHKRPKTCRAWC
jgi:hypothetical protein